MICPNCKVRWAPLPKEWPKVRLTREEEVERKIVFENDEIKYCGCMEEENG